MKEENPWITAASSYLTEDTSELCSSSIFKDPSGVELNSLTVGPTQECSLELTSSSHFVKRASFSKAGGGGAGSAFWKHQDVSHKVQMIKNSGLEL